VGPAGLAQDAGQDGVAGGGVEATALGDVDLRPDGAVHGVRPDEAEAGRRAAVDAGDGAVRLGRADGVVLAEAEALLPGQGEEHAAGVAVVGGRDAELAGQGLGLERLVGLAGEGGQDAVFEVGHGNASENGPRTAYADWRARIHAAKTGRENKASPRAAAR